MSLYRELLNHRSLHLPAASLRPGEANAREQTRLIRPDRPSGDSVQRPLESAVNQFIISNEMLSTILHGFRFATIFRVIQGLFHYKLFRCVC